jgi:orotidine-5'-phosphate decarboxylase
MTPREAMDAGAGALVIGRPITAARDPVIAARDIAQSLGIPTG